MKNIVYLKKPENLTFELECCACYVHCNDELLYLKKAPGEICENLWGVPAGKIKPAESVGHAIVRELQEETGLRVIESDLQYIQPLFVDSTLRNFVFHMFQYKVSSKPDVRISHEHTEFEWMPFDKILSLPLIPGADKSLEVYQQFLVYERQSVST